MGADPSLTAPLDGPASPPCPPLAPLIASLRADPRKGSHRLTPTPALSGIRLGTGSCWLHTSGQPVWLATGAHAVLQCLPSQPDPCGLSLAAGIVWYVCDGKARKKWSLSPLLTWLVLVWLGFGKSSASSNIPPRPRPGATATTTRPSHPHLPYSMLKLLQPSPQHSWYVLAQKQIVRQEAADPCYACRYVLKTSFNDLT